MRSYILRKLFLINVPLTFSCYIYAKHFSKNASVEKRLNCTVTVRFTVYLEQQQKIKHSQLSRFMYSPNGIRLFLLKPCRYLVLF